MKYSEEYMRDYLLGRLDKGDQQQFENDLKQDKDLLEALALQRDIIVGIQAGFDDQLRKKLEEVRDQKEGLVRPMVPTKLWKWASAAAIILGTLGVFLYMNQTTLTERLYATYFDDFPNIISPGQRDQVTAEPAFAAMDQEQWQKAIEAFSSLQEARPDEVFPQFYQGMAYLHLEQWDEAIAKFESVRQSNDQRFSDPASWYLLLGFLQNGDIEKAVLMGEFLVETNSNYSEEAGAILEALED